MLLLTQQSHLFCRLPVKALKLLPSLPARAHGHYGRGTMSSQLGRKSAQGCGPCP